MQELSKLKLDSFTINNNLFEIIATFINDNKINKTYVYVKIFNRTLKNIYGMCVIKQELEPNFIDTYKPTLINKVNKLKEFVKLFTINIDNYKLYYVNAQKNATILSIYNNISILTPYKYAMLLDIIIYCFFADIILTKSMIDDTLNLTIEEQKERDISEIDEKIIDVNYEIEEYSNLKKSSAYKEAIIKRDALLEERKKIYK